jgi:hypothetical protein
MMRSATFGEVHSRRLNRILRQGSMGDNVPYPKVRSHQDLRQNRAQIINHWQESKAQSRQTSVALPGGQ